MENLNKANLERAIEHMKNIPESRINMSHFLSSNLCVGYSKKTDSYILSEVNPSEGGSECGSSGCVIGHCVPLDSKENLQPFFFGDNNECFDFSNWSNAFFGLASRPALWQWLFSQEWDNNKEQIIGRMKYTLNTGTFHSEFATYLSAMESDLEDINHEYIENEHDINIDNLNYDLMVDII